MNAHLRLANDGDASGVAHVLLASRKEFLPYAPPVHSDSEVEHWARDSLVPSGAVTVASFDSKVVGVVAIARQGSVGWINHLYLLPAYVGLGVGSRLLEGALRELPGPVRLYTFQANIRARSFYERSGFVAVQFGDGSGNEEHCPDVLYELPARDKNVA